MLQKLEYFSKSSFHTILMHIFRFLDSTSKLIGLLKKYTINCYFNWPLKNKVHYSLDFLEGKLKVINLAQFIRI